MKLRLCCSLLFYVVFATFSQAQTTLYSENFTGQTGKGVTGNSGSANTYDVSGVNWTVDTASAADVANFGPGDYYKVINTGSDEHMEGNDLDGVARWQSPATNISGFTNVTLSIVMGESGGHESSDFVDIYYSTDNGSNYTRIPNFNTLGDGTHTLIDDFEDSNGGPVTVSVSGLSGTSFLIRVDCRNNASSEFLRFDDVTVVGTAAATTWNGTTWSNGAPGSSDDAVIASSTTPGTFTCNDLTINSGVTLTMASGNTATITGDLTNSGNGFSGTGTFSFDSDGNTLSISGNAISTLGIVNVEGTTTLSTGGLLTLSASSASSYGQITGTGTVSGNVSVESFLSPGAGGRYYYLGSPLTNATLSDFNEAGATMVSANTNQGTAWEWDAANAEWDPAGSGNLGNTAARGRGYSIYVGTNGIYGPFLRSGNGTIRLTGTTNNDDNLTTALSYNNGQSATVNFAGGTGIEDTEGWNLVANPYMAVYDWDGQTIPTDMNTAIYRFNGTNYSSYTKGAGTASRYIAPFQAFFVQLDANNPGNLTFNRSNRSAGQSASLAKTSSYAVDGAYLHIEGLNGTVYDDVFAGFDANATNNYDREWDARKLLNKNPAPNMYIKMGASSYSICRVPFTGPRSFPVMLDHSTDADQMTISAKLDQLQSFAVVSLEDKKTGVMHDLTQGPYNFTHSVAYGPDRFVLHFSQSTVGVDEHFQHTSWYAFTDESGISLELGDLKQVKVEVYNMAGQKVFSQENLNGSVTVPATVNSGVYIIRVSNDTVNESLKVIR